MDQLEKFFDDLFLRKISFQLPTNVKDVIVKIAPWVVLIIIIISIPAVLSLFGLGSFLGGMNPMVPYGFSSRYYLGLIVLTAQVILMIMAFSPLQKREAKGWTYIYYSQLISGAYALLTSYNVGAFVWSIIATGIGLYIIFQVKSYYKKSVEV